MPRKRRTPPDPRLHHRRASHPLAARLGARIRELRLERGFSFDAWAEELGRGYVSDLERGLVVPTFVTLTKIAMLLELEVADVVAIGSSPRLELLGATRKLQPDQITRLLGEAKAMVSSSAPMPVASRSGRAITAPSPSAKTAKKARRKNS